MTESTRPAAVPGNRWDLVTPRRSGTDPLVSVCIPTRNGGVTLERTLLMLALQSYPMDRIEVVVADDGSEPPIELRTSHLPFDVTAVRQSGDGFGAGRARNLAASHARGEILVFLDGDVIPEPPVIREYVSWIRGHPLCVPFGFSRFVDLSGIGDEQLTSALLARRVDQLVNPVDVDSQSYREPYLQATGDLTCERIDLFRVFVAATFAVSGELFAVAGGFRELGVRGVEDIELGYRLMNRGAVLVPVRSAQHWHQGRRTMSGARVAEIRRMRQPYVERLLPVGGFRTDPSGLTSEPVEPVTCFVAHVDDANGEGVSAAAESVLRADRADIQFANSTLVEQSNAFADVWLPADAVWSRQSSSLLVQAFNERPVGTLKLVSEHHAPVTVRRRRATNRALAIDASAADEAAIELFGVAAYLAGDMGIGAASVAATHRSWRSAAVARGWGRIKWWIRRNQSNGD
jgi:glycosyltransferase involved in cell wall biosynthesis